MVERMQRWHLCQIVEIHQKSWNKNEVSVKLGNDFLRIFYTQVLTSALSFCYVCLWKERVVAYACGFFDYESFNRAFVKENKIALINISLKRFITGNIRWYDFFNVLNEKKKLRNARFPLHQLGALALAPSWKGTSQGAEAITKTITAVLDEFKKNGCMGCCCVCDSYNIPMRKCLRQLDFEEHDVIRLLKRSVVLYEKILPGILNKASDQEDI